MLDSIASPTLWWLTIAAAVVALLAVDFVATRKLLEVSMREAVAWSAFAVPKVLQQRVLLSAIVGALVLRGIFIAAGADALERFDWVSLVFGAVLLLTGAKLLRDALAGHDHEVDINEMRVVRLVRRVMPVTEEYDRTRLVVRREGRRWLTPLALVVIAVFAPRQAGAPLLRPRRDPGLHRRQAGAALGPRGRAVGAIGAHPGLAGRHPRHPGCDHDDEPGRSAPHRCGAGARRPGADQPAGSAGDVGPTRSVGAAQAVPAASVAACLAFLAFLKSLTFCSESWSTTSATERCPSRA